MKNFGLSKRKKVDRFYRCFLSMKRRCCNPNDSKYSYYGGRGIGYSWASFKDFSDDMCGSYQSHVKEFGEKNTTLDRIDNNQSYSKENCRWATRKEQSRNRSSNRFITFRNKSQPIFAWEEELGLQSITTPYLGKFGKKHLERKRLLVNKPMLNELRT